MTTLKQILDKTFAQNVWVFSDTQWKEIEKLIFNVNSEWLQQKQMVVLDREPATTSTPKLDFIDELLEELEQND